MAGREREGGGVGDRVVGEDGDGAEADRRAQVGERDDEDDGGADGELGQVRHLVGGMDGGEAAREVAVVGHREDGAADAGEEREDEWAVIVGDADFGVARTVTVLVIACPHALGLAIRS